MNMSSNTCWPYELYIHQLKLVDQFVVVASLNEYNLFVPILVSHLRLFNMILDLQEFVLSIFL